MRIIAGTLGGRRLVAPRGLGTRPTSDRVREAVFNILGAPVAGEGARFRVLDLYCGSGALGLEAISRGADEAVLVDNDRHAVAAAQQNIDALGLAAEVRVVARDVAQALRSLDGRFDWIFADPPYAGGALERTLRILSDNTHVVAAAGLVIAEHDARTPPADRYGALALDDRRRWGATAVSFYRRETA